MTDISNSKEKVMESASSGSASYDKRTCLEKLLALLLLLLLITVVVLAALLVQYSRPMEQETCMTKECTEVAARVIGAIDYNVKPCDNFYDFACGTWMKMHVVPEDRSNLYTYRIVRDNVKITLKYLLEGDEGNEIPAVEKARNYYHSCMNTTQIEVINATELTELLESLGGWPVLGAQPGGNWDEGSFDLETDLVNIRAYGVSPIIGISVGLDERDTSKRTVIIDGTYLSFSNKDYFFDEKHASIRRSLLSYMENIAIFLGADENTARADMAEVYDLDFKLANLSLSKIETQNPEMMYNRMIISELDVQYPTANKGHAKINWGSYVQRIVDIAEENITITKEEPVVVKAPRFYMEVFDVLKDTSKRTIKNYIIWSFIQRFVWTLPKRFVDEYDKYIKVSKDRDRKAESRWKICSRAASQTYGMALGRLYVKEAFDEEAKRMALDMIHDIREAFYERLDDLDWMDSPTKKAAKEKAKVIRERIGYPDYILDDSELNDYYKEMGVDKERFFTNNVVFYMAYGKKSVSYLRETYDQDTTQWETPPSTVNAFYSTLLNVISFPAGILQPPYYSKYQPRSMNYGSIGFLIGHELTHAFDNLGRQYDKDGNLRQWWSLEAIERFQSKTTCIVEQYSKYVNPLSKLSIDGVFTKGENIADNGGIQQSFKAYQSWQKRTKVKEPKLPGLNFNHEQLFFINFAQGWCGVAKKQYETNQKSSDTHSPGRFRVIGSLQNSEDFSKAFSCPVGSYMNPQHKCHVW